MRYYHYGCNSTDKAEVKKADTISSYNKTNTKRQFSTGKKSSDGLIIEDDTIYEIDEECINCQKNKNCRER